MRAWSLFECARTRERALRSDGQSDHLPHDGVSVALSIVWNVELEQRNR